MDPFVEQRMNKHLTNFSQFAGQFAKVFVPIVDTAIKMSTEEPVSAYAVYKATKNIPAANKKPKKNQSGSSKSKRTGKALKHKSAQLPQNTKGAGELKSCNSSSPGRTSIKTENKNPKTKKFQKNLKQENSELHKSDSFNDSVAVHLEKQNISNGTRKYIEAETKKEFENHIVNQLELNDAQLEESDDSINSANLEEDNSDFESCSDEYTLNNKTVYFHCDKTETYDGGSSSTNEEDDQATEALDQAVISRKNKKRKSPDVDASKTKSGGNASSVVSEVKKTKKTENFKTASLKTLPDVKEPIQRRTSSVSSHGSKTPATKNFLNGVSPTCSVKLEPLLPPTDIVKLNSIEEGKRALKWLLNPVSVDDFFAKYWEQKSCLIKRQQSNYFGHLISFEAIDQMLIKNHVEFTKNIDVTSYENGVRETLNPEGRALPPVVWDHYGQGCSIRLLNPQTFLSNIFTLSTTMQEYFHCLVGANAYLTPPNSQGFAPHYDDIEAFVLQIEGRKRWKLYKPRSTSEILPRYSSKNFTQEEIGTPVFEEVLEPGDILYFPRGTIHQACTEPGFHSLHITLSTYQKQSFADLFEKMLPLMLQKAITSNVDLRRGLPLHVWQHAGIAFSDSSTKERADLTRKVTQLMHKCIRDMPMQQILDAGLDELAKKFQHEALPPEIFPAEKLRTVFGSRNRTNERGECVCDYDIDERTNVRLLRANILRLVQEKEKLCIYYYLDNSREYCEYEPNFIEIEPFEAASVEVLIKSYPQYVGVSQLPLPSDEQKITLATALWERGLLMMERPFR